MRRYDGYAFQVRILLTDCREQETERLRASACLQFSPHPLEQEQEARREGGGEV